MGITRLECPECGATVRIGVPESTEVTAVAASPTGLAAGEGKHRVVGCRRGHEVHVQFAP